MIAPFDVHVVKLHQFIQNNIRVRAAVEDIADDVQPVDAARADQFAKCLHKRPRHAGLYDRMDDFPVIAVLVFLRVRVQQFVDDVRKVCGHLFADLRARVFGGDGLAHLHQPVDRYAVPVGQLLRRAFPAHLAQHFRRAVNQHRQLCALFFAHGTREQGLDFVPDNTGSTVQ